MRRWRFPAALLAGVLLLFVAVSFTTDGRLVAEPYFTVRDGYKCSKCHVNRTGGGKRSDYAKVYMATRMAANPGGEVATGDFGHGRLNEYFSLSADVRAIAEYRRFDGEQPSWHFGRRGACESCHQTFNGGGKLAEIYEQLEVMPGKASIVLGQSLLPNVSSREAFGLLESERLNGYLKAGTFRMPTALRNTWDDPYLHGTVGFSATHDLVGLEAVRGEGVEMGIEPGPFSLSLSVTNPGALDSLGSTPAVGKRVHLNAYAVGSLGLLGATIYNDPVREDLERDFTALYGGVSLGRVTGLLELDAYKESDPLTKTEVKKQAMHAEIDVLVAQGHNLKWQYEAYDPNTEAKKDRSDRTSVIYEPFLTPYLQVRTGARRSEGPRSGTGLNGTTIFAELHLMY